MVGTGYVKAGVQELHKLLKDDDMWIKSFPEGGGGRDVLDEDKYQKAFPGSSKRNRIMRSWTTESSRAVVKQLHAASPMIATRKFLISGFSISIDGHTTTSNTCGSVITLVLRMLVEGNQSLQERGQQAMESITEAINQTVERVNDEFACPALFPWNSDLNVIKDPAPFADEFSQRKYDLLLANPAPFRKFPDEFLCWVGLSRHYPLDEETYPTFLDSRNDGLFCFHSATTGRIVPLLPIAPSRPEGELEAIVDRLFDGSGSDDHGESAEGGNIVSEQVETVIEDAPVKKVRRQKKRKAVVEDVSAEYVIGRTILRKGTIRRICYRKSQAVLDSLLADARLNVEIGVSPIPTMPFITSYVSVTPDSSHHSSTHPADTEVDSHVRSPTVSVPVMTQATTTTTVLNPIAVAQEKPVSPSPFLTGSHSTGGASPSARGFTDLTGSEFVVGGFRTVVNPDADLQKVYVPKWNVTNGSGVDTATDCRENVDELAPPRFFAVVRNMEHDQLFIEFNIGTARQVCLSVEVRTRAEFNIRERRRLSAKCKEQESLLVQTNEENASLKEQLLLKEAEAIRLRGQAYAFEAMEKSLREEVKLLRERSLALEKKRDSFVAASQAVVADKECEVATLNSTITSVQGRNDVLLDQVHQLESSCSNLRKEITDADLVAAVLHLEETFCHHLLTAVASRRWLLDHGMKLVVVKCLNSPEYLSALGTFEPGRRSAYNPSADADYDAAMQQFRDVSFSLLLELKSRKDASIEEVMDILRLEGSLAELLGMGDLQPSVDQLMVPIYHPEDPVAVGSTSLSFSLDVLNQRVERIRGNLAANRSALLGVFSPLTDPLSSIVLTGGEAVPENIPAVPENVSEPASTTTTLRTTLAMPSSTTPLFVEDYDISDTDVAYGSMVCHPDFEREAADAIL
ncbi:hypothetical protein Tco_1386220 [Tanacetum coccineum]